MDTHAAAVFLAGGHALKVKRAVRFPFLDYSTIEKRKAACTAELEINRRFAPALYRRIVPITRQPDGRLALDGGGEPVDWAVEMTRFDENQTLDHVVERGALGDELATKLARTVATLHEQAERADAAPCIAALESYIGQNTAAFRENQSLFLPESVTALDRASRTALERLRPLLLSRGDHGLFRRCHGDLHLGNIAVLDGEPIAFDAIEFDPIMGSGDVLYDLAFLLMDLVQRDLVEPANRVLNEYFAAAKRIEDCDGLAALPFFMSLRAAIRAKVTAARLEQIAPENRDELVRPANHYFQLALNLLSPLAPRIVCVGGLSGTGKSVLARALAPSISPVPGALVLRSDVERKSLFGVVETEPLPAHAYQPEVSGRLYALLFEKAGRIARAGHSTVIDAVFDKASERAAIEAKAHDAAVAFHGLFLTADLDTRLKRIGARRLDASDADAAVARQQEQLAIGQMNWTVVDASGPPAQTLARALEQLALHR